MCEIDKLTSLTSRGREIPVLADEPAVHPWAGVAGAGGQTVALLSAMGKTKLGRVAGRGEKVLMCQGEK
jgi:hypothetical protein